MIEIKISKRKFKRAFKSEKAFEKFYNKICKQIERRAIYDSKRAARSDKTTDTRS